MSNTPDEEIALRIELLKLDITDAVKAAAIKAGVSIETAHAAFAAALRPWLRTQGAVITDGRTNRWRVRVRLYDSAHPDDAAADTDPDLKPDEGGTEIIPGLPNVAGYVAEIAAGFHQITCVGLDGPTMRHKLKGLRPTLSRRGGNAVWRLPYVVNAREWLARVDIERVES